MIQIVYRPVEAPVVKGEGLYEAVFNGEKLGFFVRAKNAREAERKTMIVFRHELPAKTLDFNADDYPLYDRKEEDDGDNGGEKDTEADRPDGQSPAAELHPE